MVARELGLDESRLEGLVSAIETDVAEERYDGAVIVVARRGQVAVHEAIGFAERASGRRASTDDVFCLMSVTKTFTSAEVLRESNGSRSGSS
jgi:CubicO group peptidase (beta-lactamase class C family)